MSNDCTFSVSSVVSLKFSSWPTYIQYGTIFQKTHVRLSNFFKYVLYLTVLSKFLKKSGVTVLV